MSKKDGKFEKGNKVNQKYNYEEVAIELDSYINDKECPILVEFAYLNNYNIKTLYSIKDEAVKELLKKAVQKKEFYLESKCLSGDINPAMAIFSLKQLGWKDKQEHDHTTKGEAIGYTIVTSEETKKNMDKLKDI